jgi:hypothetical protein
MRKVERLRTMWTRMVSLKGYFLVRSLCGLLRKRVEAADRDEAIEIIKYLVDKRIARTPGGPLSVAAEWYTQTLAPAAKRHNAVLAVKEKKIAQVTEIWGAGWQAIIDPGQLLFSSGN